MAAEKAKNFFVIPCHDHANQQTGKAQDGQIQRTMARGELLTDREPALPAGKKFALRDPAALPSETGVATDTGTRTQQMNEEGVTDDVFRGVIILFKCR